MLSKQHQVTLCAGGVQLTTAASMPRPPSPERPSTPFFRPARRRQLTPAFAEAGPCSPELSQSWAGSNKMFAPMHMPLHQSSASAHAGLPVRPATASFAESSSYAAPDLSWTGSLQLPAGLLKLAARPGSQTLGHKNRHQYDWGFGKSKSAA